MSKAAEAIQNGLLKPQADRNAQQDFLSSGSTLLNLACSGKTKGAYLKGGYYYWVGDSSSGKSFFSLTAFAEAAANKNFDDYRFIFDEPERGALMDREKFFGKETAKRIEFPSMRDGPSCSQTVEEFYFNLDDAIEDGRPFIYVLDSENSLSSAAERTKFKKNKKAYFKALEKETDEDEDSASADEAMKGSYGDGKPKKHSEFLRQAISELPKLGAILLVIGQTRDKIGRMPVFGGDTKTRSGGWALEFYATMMLWSSVKEPIKTLVRGQKVEQGKMCKIRVRKNRETGVDRTVEVPIYHSYGVDDIGSCVNFMLKWNAWKKHRGVIDATDLSLELKETELIRAIEADTKVYNDLQRAVRKVWLEIEAEAALDRQPRYGKKEKA